LDKLNIVFAGTPDIADITLNNLIANNFNIQLVLTQPDRPSGRGQKLTPPAVKLTANQNKINVLQPTKLRNNQQLFEHLKQINPDIIIVIAYGMIIPKEILSIPRLGCINIHVSLLPRYRGAAPIQRAIECGDTKTGITIMKMDEGLDTGDILIQREIAINSVDTTKTLHDKLAILGSELIVEYLNNHNEYQPIKQSDIEISYADKIAKNEAKINWQDDNITLDRKVRAFNPFPICYTYLHDLLIKIWAVRLNENKTNQQAGTIIAINKDSISVACGNHSIIDIIEIQLAGKSKTKISEFLLGHKINISDVFI
jgi:methionyl-tRNA formyltransferase